MSRPTIPARSMFARPYRARRALTPDYRRGFAARRAIAVILAIVLGGTALTQFGLADAANATVTIWGKQAPAKSYVGPDTAAVELGTRFTATAPGVVTGVRFYKAAGVTGRHTGTLWSASGARLATTTFTRESRKGWQTATFSTPVRLTPGATYVVSYHVPKGGRYVMTKDHSGRSLTSALTVPRKNAGAFSYGKKAAFPTSTWRSSTYWVDVTFLPDVRTNPSPTPTSTPDPTPTTGPTDPTPTDPTPTDPTPTDPTPTDPTPTDPTPTVPTETPTPEPTTPGTAGVLAFDYANRAELLAAGWGFHGESADGSARNTEQSGSSGLAYSASGLTVTAGAGDLWKELNNTRNSLFRNLPDDWTGAELSLDFAPRADYQQAGLVVYGSDDDYVQLMRQYNSAEGNQSAGFVAETGQEVVVNDWTPTTSTRVRLRLERTDGIITGSVSSDNGASWTQVSSADEPAGTPRLGIIVGANESGGTPPTATLREAIVADPGSPLPPATEAPKPTPSDPTSTPNEPTSPTPTPTAPTPTPTQPGTPTPTAPAIKGFPSRETTGVPAGWTPKLSVTGDYTITQDGAVVEDLRVTNGTLWVRASNVTLRRVEVVGGRIVNDYGRTCWNGLLIEDSSILRGDHDPENPVIEAGGYTLRRVKIDGPSEGVRIGEKGMGCGPVLIEESWMQIDPPDNCVAGAVDWHGDGLQGYQGDAVTIRNSSIRLAEVPGCMGTAAFFYPDQGNTRATVENLLVSGGGYVFRLATPGSVSGLKVVDDSWDYAPVDVATCSQVAWGSGNEVVKINADGSLTSVRSLNCEAH